MISNTSKTRFINQAGIYILFFLTSMQAKGPLLAQQQDAVGWGTLSVEKKINRHISVSLMNQYILNQNYSELGLFFIDGGLQYRLNSNFAFSANYRFINYRNRDNFYQNRQMWYADISYNKSWGRISAGFRSRYQQQYYGMSFVENYRPSSSYSRNRLTLRYKINWYYTLFVSGEVFTRLRPLTVTDAYRTTAGINRQFNLHHRLEFSYAIQQQVNRKNKRRVFITAITYYFKF